ncbi:GGDEF domain-containing protein (plasmid) [Pseudorhodobacter turbinis]|uniref:GGDEF domain-containing protein n=1 Tax=Pseudorhodobacter turbinis TaxID=2500533 RepID=A0A4P8EJY9_9RHOB|nr:GGDEF domain-containing protein [Pseudorhodobacter turbinis]QCO57510.1 GGDEF domain-containing protein [Pseudorhodobacter turbinis]
MVSVASSTQSLQIGRASANRLMPMHIWVSATGRIESAGTTLQKAFGTIELEGENFFDLFEVRGPGGIFAVDDLHRRAGKTLSICPRIGTGAYALRGIAVPLEQQGAVLLNLSFGVGVIYAVSAFQLTAADFAATELAMELLYLVEAKTAVTEELRRLNLRLKGARDEAEQQALTDMLTGLRNRRALDLTMTELIEGQVPFGLMHIDLDYFKAVNDTLGHAAGDHVLREVARSLLSETRDCDTVARVGGDEFVIVFQELTDSEKLSNIADRVVERLREPSFFGGKPCRISASIGITISINYCPPEADRMLSDADEALYASKNAGRGQAQMFKSSMEDRRALGN